MVIPLETIQMEESRKQILKDEFQKDYFFKIKEFLLKEKQSGKIIFPKGPDIFNAFNQTPFDKVRVVLLGQDPYHGVGEAHGLCFSVQDGVKWPPSLQNIFKELQSDVGIPFPSTGNLTKWAKQGIFLLNSILTVRKDEAGSHKDIGWQQFTDAVIQKLSEKKSGLIFLLWGNYAQSKEILIDKNKHFILKAAHPSPFSAHKGFFSCKHFSKVNEILIAQNHMPIDWSL